MTGRLFSPLRGIYVVLILTLMLTSCSQQPQPFTFVQICDTQIGMVDYEKDKKMFEQAVKQINELNPDFVIICGDLIMDPDEKSYADFLSIKEGFNMPCYCVPGNHDVGDMPTPESLKYYRETVGDDYFTIDHKGYSFVLVNTQLWDQPLEGESEKHDAWFNDTLKASTDAGKSIFIAGHFPLFLNTPDEGDDYFALPPEKRKDLLAVIEKNSVVAVLGGHTHKTYINEYKGIQLVNPESICRNIDGRP
ncbi:metallophosphoesterase, partial [candidate division KSB1 bacterium]